VPRDGLLTWLKPQIFWWRVRARSLAAKRGVDESYGGWGGGGGKQKGEYGARRNRPSKD